MSSETKATVESAPSIAPEQGFQTDGGANSTEFISFAIGDEQYGVAIMAVREIKGWSTITVLPNQPDYMRGVLNLRGVMVPIIDLRCRFSQGLTEATPMHIVIVVQVANKTIGLLADRVLDIVSVDTAQIQPVPHVSRLGQGNFLAGLVTVQDGMIALLDLDRLLEQSETEAIEAA